MRNKTLIAITSALLVSGSGSAFAEGPGQGQPPVVMAPDGQPQQQTYYQEPAPQAQPAPMEAQQGQAQQGQAQQGRGIQYGAHLIVPIFLTNPVAIVDNGVATGSADAGFGLGLQARAGWEFGYGFSAEINVGGTFNGVNGEIGGVDFDPQTSLYMFWIGAGARYAFLNPSAIVPFVGAGAGLLFQSFCPDEAPSCDLDPAATVNALAGVIYEVSPYVGIEAGLQLNVVFPNDTVFVSTELFLTPFVGATLYY